MNITLGIKMWGGRRYLVEVEPKTDTTHQCTLETCTYDVFLALGLEVAQHAEVIINLTDMRYLKNKNSGRMVADTLDTVVYWNGNARAVTVETLQENTNVLHRNR